MLINVSTDRKFQQFLDRREQELHVAMVPIIARGIRMTITRGSTNASMNMVKRGETVLTAHFKRIFREVYGSVNRAELQKQAEEDNEDINEFMDAQLDWIRREAATSITDVAHSIAGYIRDKVFQGVQQGWSNDRIAQELAYDVPDLARDRAATIARTETHGAAMWAMDETIDFKEIEIQTKRWWTANDGRVRASHAVMHDVAIPRSEAFSLDGGDMMYPGDDSLGADASEIINCRCAVLYETA